MLLPEKLIWMFGEDGCTAVKLYCREDDRTEIASRFVEAFDKECEVIRNTVEQKSLLRNAVKTDYGVFFSFGPLAIYSGWGDYLKVYDMGEALKNALFSIKREYPAVHYEGYACYGYSDVYGGEQIQYEINSDETRDTSTIVYDFVGKALGNSMKDKEIWERFAARLADADQDEFDQILHAIHAYTEWIDFDVADRFIDYVKKQIRE